MANNNLANPFNKNIGAFISLPTNFYVRQTRDCTPNQELNFAVLGFYFQHIDSVLATPARKLVESYFNRVDPYNTPILTAYDNLITFRIIATILILDDTRFSLDQRKVMIRCLHFALDCRNTVYHRAYLARLMPFQIRVYLSAYEIIARDLLGCPEVLELVWLLGDALGLTRQDIPLY